VQDLIGEYCQGNGVDVGCGWRKMGGPILGIDSIPWGYQSGGDREDPHYSQADWCCDCRDLPVKDDSLDFVFSHHLLEHVGDIDTTDDETRKALTEWTRVLKPGGFLVVVLPDIRFCISPYAKRKYGKRIPHGLRPDDVKVIIEELPLKVHRFNRFKEAETFEIVAEKV
jgi:SAM-dependent methyltransferase